MLERMLDRLLWLQQEEIIVCLGTPRQLSDWTCRRFEG